MHGLTLEFLSDKPRFAEVVEPIREFVRDAELIIHNASFDTGFLDMEFQLLGLPPFREHVGGVIDTLRKRARCSPASAIRSMRCAIGWASATRTGRCTAPCWMRNCWPRSTSP